MLCKVFLFCSPQTNQDIVVCEPEVRVAIDDTTLRKIKLSATVLGSAPKCFQRCNKLTHHRLQMWQASSLCSLENGVESTPSQLWNLPANPTLLDQKRGTMILWERISTEGVVVLIYNFFIINVFFTQIRFSCSL